MSYAFNNTVSFEGTPQVDAFSRFRTSQLTSILEIKHVYDKNPLFIDEILNGSATSVWDNQHSDVEMNTFSNDDYVIRQTKARGVYSPGKGGLFNTTFMNFHKQNNVIKRFGYYSTNTSTPYDGTADGFFLESNGATDEISFQVWRSGVMIKKITQAQFNATVIDPTTIDWQKNQLFWCDFAWLGTGRLRFGLFIPNVGMVELGQFSPANTLEDPYMTNPNQPIRYEIRQVGAGSGTFHQLCSSYSIEGAFNSLTKSAAITNPTARVLATPGIKYPLLGYRCANAWKGANIVLDSVYALNQITGTDYLITIEMNPGITGGTPSWSQVTNTPIEYSLLGGTATVNAAGQIIKSLIGKGNSSSADNYALADNLIKPGISINGTKDEIWVCVTPLVTSGSTTIRAMVANLNYFD